MLIPFSQVANVKHIARNT